MKNDVDKNERQAQSNKNNAAEGSLSDQAYEGILRRIFDGRLSPGERVSEVRLSEMLEMSRTPVHEAVGQLSADGLIIQEPRRQPVIAKFSAEDVADVFGMRSLLEAEAARRAAVNMSAADVFELRRLASDVRRELGSDAVSETWADFDTAFHERIADAAGSARLAKDIKRYCRLHFHINRIYVRDMEVEVALTEHEAILDAIEDQDPKAASERMRAHISHWQVYFAGAVRRQGS